MVEIQPNSPDTHNGPDSERDESISQLQGFALGNLTSLAVDLRQIAENQASDMFAGQDQESFSTEQERAQAEPLFDDLSIDNPIESQRSTYHKVISFTAEPGETISFQSEVRDTNGRLIRDTISLSEYLGSSDSAVNINRNSAFLRAERLEDGRVKYVIGVKEGFAASDGSIQLTVGGRTVTSDASGSGFSSAVREVESQEQQPNAGDSQSSQEQSAQDSVDEQVAPSEDVAPEQSSLLSDLSVDDPVANQRGHYHKVITFTADADDEIDFTTQHYDNCGNVCADRISLSDYQSRSGGASHIQRFGGHLVVKPLPDGRVKYIIGVSNSLAQAGGTISLSVNGQTLSSDASGAGLIAASQAGQEQAQEQQAEESQQQQTPDPSPPAQEQTQQQEAIQGLPESFAGLQIEGNVISFESDRTEQVDIDMNVPGGSQYRQSMSIGSNPTTTSSSFTVDGIKYKSQRLLNGRVRHTIDVTNGVSKLENGLMTVSLGGESITIDPNSKPPKVIQDISQSIEGEDQFQQEVLDASIDKPVFVIASPEGHKVSQILLNRLNGMLDSDTTALATVDTSNPVNREELHQLWDDKVPVLRIFIGGHELKIKPKEGQEGITIPIIGVPSQEQLQEIYDIVNEIQESRPNSGSLQA